MTIALYWLKNNIFLSEISFVVLQKNKQEGSDLEGGDELRKVYPRVV